MFEVIDASPSDDGDWILIRTDTLKPHFVHKCLLPALVADLEGRSTELNTEHTRLAYIEFAMTSFIFYGTPREVLKLDSLNITILSRDVCLAIDKLASLQPRKFSDGTEYFKLKSSFNCMVLTLAQRDLLLSGILSIRDDADSRYEDFICSLMNKNQISNED